MNNRTRQWMKAEDMILRADPPVVCSIHYPGKKYLGVLIVRYSQLPAAKEKYGDQLEVWFEDEIEKAYEKMLEKRKNEIEKI